MANRRDIPTARSRTARRQAGAADRSILAATERREKSERRRAAHAPTTNARSTPIRNVVADLTDLILYTFLDIILLQRACSNRAFSGTEKLRRSTVFGRQKARLLRSVRQP